MPTCTGCQRPAATSAASLASQGSSAAISSSSAGRGSGARSLRSRLEQAFGKRLGGLAVRLAEVDEQPLRGEHIFGQTPYVRS